MDEAVVGWGKGHNSPGCPANQAANTQPPDFCDDIGGIGADSLFNQGIIPRLGYRSWENQQWMIY